MDTICPSYGLGKTRQDQATFTLGVVSGFGAIHTLGPFNPILLLLGCLGSQVHPRVPIGFRAKRIASIYNIYRNIYMLVTNELTKQKFSN